MRPLGLKLAALPTSGVPALGMAVRSPMDWSSKILPMRRPDGTNKSMTGVPGMGLQKPKAIPATAAGVQRAALIKAAVIAAGGYKHADVKEAGTFTAIGKGFAGGAKAVKPLPAIKPVSANLAAGPTTGALLGGLTGDQFAPGGTDVNIMGLKLNVPGAIAGAAAFTRGAGRMGGAGAGRLGKAVGAAADVVRPAVAAGGVGSVAEGVADHFGFKGTGLGGIGAYAGAAAGLAGRRLGGRIGNTQRSMLSDRVTQGAMEATKGLTYAARAPGEYLYNMGANAVKGVGGMPAFSSPLSMGSRLGNTAAVTGAALAVPAAGWAGVKGVGEVGRTVVEGLHNTVAPALTNQVLDQVENRMTNMGIARDGRIDVPGLVDQAMRPLANKARQFGDGINNSMTEMGIRDPDTGRLTVTPAMQQSSFAGAALRKADYVLRAMNIDPSRVSAIEKLMMLGGTGMGVAGAGMLGLGAAGAGVPLAMGAAGLSPLLYHYMRSRPPAAAGL